MKKSLFYPSILCLPLLLMNTCFAKLTPLYFRNDASQAKFIFFNSDETSPLDMAKQASNYVDCKGAHGFAFITNGGIKEYLELQKNEKKISDLNLCSYSPEDLEEYFKDNKVPNNPTIGIPLREMADLYGINDENDAFTKLKSAYKNPLKKTPDNDNGSRNDSGGNSSNTKSLWIVLAIVAVGIGVSFIAWVTTQKKPQSKPKHTK